MLKLFFSTLSSSLIFIKLYPARTFKAHSPNRLEKYIFSSIASKYHSISMDFTSVSLNDFSGQKILLFCAQCCAYNSCVIKQRRSFYFCFLSIFVIIPCVNIFSEWIEQIIAFFGYSAANQDFTRLKYV